jgi:hypothetical protein
MSPFQVAADKAELGHGPLKLGHARAHRHAGHLGNWATPAKLRRKTAVTRQMRSLHTQAHSTAGAGSATWWPMCEARG